MNKKYDTEDMREKDFFKKMNILKEVDIIVPEKQRV